VKLRDSVQADLVIQATSAHTASDLRKMLAGLRAIVAYAAANGKKAPAYGPVLADVIHSIKIAGKQGTVTVHLQITTSQIEKSLRQLQQQ
jgi:hypothetical protein